MPHPRFKSENYENLGGANPRASIYLTGPREALSLYNFDFSVVGALTKRPGSTQYIGQTFGCIVGMHEFIKTNGFSELIVTEWSGATTANNLFWHGISTGNLVGLTLTTLGTQAPVVTNIYNTNLGFTGGAPFFFSTTQFSFIRSDISLSSGTSLNQWDYVNYLDQMYMTNGRYYFRYNGISPFLVNIPPTGAGNTTVTLSGSLFFGASGGSSYRLPLGTVYHFYAALVNNNGVEGPLSHLGMLDLFATGTTIATNWGTFPVLRANIWTPQDYGLSAINMYIAVSTGDSAGLGAQGFTALHLDMRFLGKTTVTASEFTRIDYGLNTDQINAGGVTALPVPLQTVYPYLYQSMSGYTYLGNIAVNQGYTLASQFLEVYNNRLAFCGFSNLPSSFILTEIDQPESILPENVIEVRTNDGDILTGAKTYLNQLVLFKQNSIHSFSGDAPENFYLKEISAEYGCLNNKANCIWENKLWFLDSKGVCEFNGANVQIVSDKVSVQFEAMNLDAAKKQAIMAHVKERGEIWCSIPVNGATLNNLTIIYDYVGGGWGYWDGFSPKFFDTIKQRFVKPSAFYADNSGRINSFGISYFGDNGAGISAVVMNRYENPEGQSNEKMFRRLFLNYESVTGATVSSFSVNFRKNYGTSIVLASSMTLTSFQKVKNFGISAKSLSVEFGHSSATERIRLYGYTLEYRHQRAT